MANYIKFVSCLVKLFTSCIFKQIVKKHILKNGPGPGPGTLVKVNPEPLEKTDSIKTSK